MKPNPNNMFVVRLVYHTFDLIHQTSNLKLAPGQCQCVYVSNKMILTYQIKMSYLQGLCKMFVFQVQVQDFLSFL